jgi:hypothetical protein
VHIFLRVYFWLSFFLHPCLHVHVETARFSQWVPPHPLQRLLDSSNGVRMRVHMFGMSLPPPPRSPLDRVPVSNLHDLLHELTPYNLLHKTPRSPASGSRRRGVRVGACSCRMRRGGTGTEPLWRGESGGRSGASVETEGVAELISSLSAPPPVSSSV